MTRKRLIQSAILVLGLGVLAAPVVVRSSAFADQTTLYVDSRCAHSGDGTKDSPFCTISAAAAVVNPGQTVVVLPGNYSEAVTLSRSGTPSAPITFQAANSPDGYVRVGNYAAAVSGHIVTVSNVHDVVVRGFYVSGAGQPETVLVTGSSNVTFDQGAIEGLRATPFHVTGASSNVTVSRESLLPQLHPAVQVDAGATGTVISTDTVQPGASPSPAIQVTDATGTTITSNTIVSHCVIGISLAGASSGAVLENNIVDTASHTLTTNACPNPAGATAIAVDSAATSGTVADYNLTNPQSGGALYAWGGTNYSDLSAFTGATGQGTHDLAADPKLSLKPGSDSWYVPAVTSPAVDSARADAPGELATDQLDLYREDDPAVPNTGTGIGYTDRGAVELRSTASIGGPVLSRKAGGSPLAVNATVSITPQWTGNGPTWWIAYRFDDDARHWVITRQTSVDYTFHKAGAHSVFAYSSQDLFRTGVSSSTGIVVGGLYQPLTPIRVLDTRAAIGVSTTTPVAPGADVVIPVTAPGMPAASDVSGIVLNVTAVAPNNAGYLTVYPHGSGLPGTSNINFAAHETRPNLVTVPDVDGSAVFHNGSSGTVHIVADLEGYFAGTGYGLKPQSPVRVLDTRHALSTATTSPVPAGGTITLDMSGALPADATAVVLNVTVTQPTGGGYLTAYPDGQARPVASNLNFSAGETVPNLVIVPVTAGKVQIYNGSGGTTHVVADLNGYFGTAASGATQQYVPYGPARVMDTRNYYGNGPNPVGPSKTTQVWPEQLNHCVPTCPSATATFFNLTVTQETGSGYLTGYPASQARPTASNLNFVAGQTVANLTLLQNGLGDFIYNGSGGTVHVIADESGYFIAPAS